MASENTLSSRYPDPSSPSVNFGSKILALNSSWLLGIQSVFLGAQVAGGPLFENQVMNLGFVYFHTKDFHHWKGNIKMHHYPSVADKSSLLGLDLNVFLDLWLWGRISPHTVPSSIFTFSSPSPPCHGSLYSLPPLLLATPPLPSLEPCRSYHLVSWPELTAREMQVIVIKIKTYFQIEALESCFTSKSLNSG